MLQPISVRMLGEFSLTAGDVKLSDANSRSRKVWLLLAYLICCRDRVLSQQKLIDVLWGDDAASTNPENALRITLHRLRSQLDTLWPGAGRELVCSRDGGYCWNPAAEITLDCEEFEKLLLSVSQEESRLERYFQALSLYRGDFLPRQSSESWVIPIVSHFHNLYLQTTLDAAQLLIQRSRFAEAAALCRRCIQSEPYHEPLHQLLMQALGSDGKPREAGAVYDTLSKRLFDDFGIRPSEQTRAVYRTAAHSPEDRSIPMDEVWEQLQEPTNHAGALVCDYDYFKVLCYAESRAMERSGDAAHVALLSVAGTEAPLTKRSQSRIMEQLGEQLRLNLRRGDAISRCSVSQYIIMLPKCNYENSSMVCRRVLGAFHRAHPHVNVKINYMVQPLSPSICVP